MTHVLVFHPDSAIRALFTQVLEEEGYTVTTVGGMDDALMVLRASLHPIVAIAEWIPRSSPPLGEFFEPVRDHPEYYGQHRYIALHACTASDDAEAAMQALHLYFATIPCQIDTLMDLVADAVRSTAGR